MTLRVELDRGAYEPGDSALVTVRWALDRAPEQAVLHLIYEARTEHEHESFTVTTVDLATRPSATTPTGTYRDAPRAAAEGPPLAAEDRRHVEIELPRAPNSYRGTYLTIAWTVLVRVDPLLEAHAPLVIAPGREALGATPAPPESGGVGGTDSDSVRG